jgi:site-specific recombinase XerD
MAYNSAWRKWASWCGEKEVDPFQAPVELVVDYLTGMFQAQYAYSTINGARSAISALHVPIEGTPVGQHGLVKRLMAGVFNERTPMPRYADTWDVNVVLDYIKQLGTNRDLSDKNLAHKLAMLLALTTANRASEIQGLDLEFMSDEEECITFTINKLTKTRRVGGKPQKVTVHQFQEDPSLDVVECIRAYIRRTHSWRLTTRQHRLLLGIVAPHNPVCTSTISNWLKQMMEAAGIDVTAYKGHSTRAAATSKARAGGLSVAEIVKRANWKRASTFEKFYNKETPREGDEFARAVLG